MPWLIDALVQLARYLLENSSCGIESTARRSPGLASSLQGVLDQRKPLAHPPQSPVDQGHTGHPSLSRAPADFPNPRPLRDLSLGLGCDGAAVGRGRAALGPDVITHRVPAVGRGLSPAWPTTVAALRA